jgi:uncharacterized membrane-anchored protein YitT (DUF2179 family)
MIPRVLACVALAVWWLTRIHVTLWLVGHPVATIPVLYLAGLFAAAFTAAFAAFLWRMHAASGGTLAWRTG